MHRRTIVAALLLTGVALGIALASPPTDQERVTQRRFSRCLGTSYLAETRSRRAQWSSIRVAADARWVREVELYEVGDVVMCADMCHAETIADTAALTSLRDVVRGLAREVLSERNAFGQAMAGAADASAAEGVNEPW